MAFMLPGCLTRWFHAVNDMMLSRFKSLEGEMPLPRATSMGLDAQTRPVGLKAGQTVMPAESIVHGRAGRGYFP